MISKEWWRLSLLWLFAHKNKGSGPSLIGRTLIVAVFALSLGVAALSFTLSLVSGFERTISDQISSFYSPMTFSFHWKDKSDFSKIYAQYAEDVEKMEFLWRGQALVVGPNGGRGAVLESRYRFPEYSGSKENYLPLQIGKALADHLGVVQGDPVHLLMPGLFEKSLKSKVEEITQIGVYEIDSRAIVLNQSKVNESYLTSILGGAAQKKEGDAYAARVFLKKNQIDIRNKDQLESLRLSFQEKWKQLFPEDEKLRVQLWFEQKENLLGSIRMDKTLLMIVLSFLVLVAALNVAAALMVLYLERDREIALVRSIGLAPSQLVFWVLSKGFVLGLVSGVLGISLAYAFSLFLKHSGLIKIPPEVYNINSLPLYFDRGEQFFVFVFALFSAMFVAGVLGRRMSKLSLIESLSHRR